MDSAEFLDLLGNANRRRILRLLAQKPCYVTEISEFLGVSPKAVIDHLRKLEEAGLVESRTDEKQRKYFSIARHVRLEVTVSPYEFGTKSAYPTSSRLDITTCRRLSVEVESDDDEDELGGSTDLAALTARLHEFKTLERELSMAQRWAQGRITELRDQLESTISGGNSRLVVDVLLALAADKTTPAEIAEEAGAPPEIVTDVLADLVSEGIVEHDGKQYGLAE
jgi:ArsR family transcriptional regulator